MEHQAAIMPESEMRIAFLTAKDFFCVSVPVAPAVPSAVPCLALRLMLLEP
jgi:hypothetical protein